MSAADRPPGLAPTWASDATWNSPGDPWDGLPTKTAPSAGIISQGYIPNEQPPPDRENWWKNTLKLFGTYQDTFEVQNWLEGVGSGNSVNATEAIRVCEVDGFNQLVGGHWTGGRRTFVANGDLIYSSSHGTVWNGESLAGSPPTFQCIAGTALGNSIANNVIAAGDTTTIELWTSSSQTWSAVTSPATQHSFVIWQSQLVRFIFGCVESSTVPHILFLDGNGGTPVDVALTLPAGYSGHVGDLSQMIASSPTTIATTIWNTDGTVHVAFFYVPTASSIGAAWTLSQPTLTTESPGFAFFYDASRGLFFFVTQDGHIYSTPDVITFTDLGYTIPYTGAGTAGTNGSISVRGSIWMMCTTHAQLLYSVDAGQTWIQVPAPFVGGSSDYQQYVMKGVYPLLDRFATLAAATSNGSPHQISFSRRLR
jgi:hypothetical protein